MKKKAKRKSVLKSIFKALILVLIIMIIIFCFLVYQNGWGLKGFLMTILGQNKESINKLDTVYFLVLGISTDLENDLTDTIMVCGYNPKSNQAMMLSIPRDTFIGKDKNRARGTDKINSLYCKGVDKTVEAVEELTNIDIDYYMVINNDILIKLVDSVGGVFFDVPIDMNYDDPTQDLHIHLEKGMQLIDGEKAEQLLRFRHNNDGSSYSYEYGDNDYGRMKTQREFLKATLEQSIKVQNVFKFKKVLDIIMNDLETNMKIENMLPYIPYILDMDFSNIRTEQLPGASELCNKVWIYVHNERKTKELVNDLIINLE